MQEEIDQMIQKMLEDAASKDLSPSELERLEKKVEVFKKAKE